jgi:DNA polymerase III subunit epsilon
MTSPPLWKYTGKNREEPKMSHVQVQVHAVKAGERYRHYKGGLYEIICQAIQESDLSQVVVYRPLAGDTHTAWTRPLHVFFEAVQVGERTTQRFTRVDGD